jgi:hypothetical protein
VRIETFVDNPSGFWLYAERYMSVGTRTYSPFAEINEIEPVYRPEALNERFQISSKRIPVEHGAFLSASEIDQSIAKIYELRSSFLLPVHPATVSRLPAASRKALESFEAGPTFDVSPTASTRTVYVHSNDDAGLLPPHFIKLHFPGRISRFVRSLTEDDVMHQLGVSREVQQRGLPCLPDVAGGYTVFSSDSSIGYILRSFTPRCGLAPPFFTMPGFGLYGRDRHSPDDPYLLQQLPQALGLSANEFLINRVVIPAIELWLRVALDCGIVPELHGQNILFCFDLKTRRTAICFRDMDVTIDPRLRKLFGLPVADFEDTDDRALGVAAPDQLLSLSYDGLLVHHFLARVAALGHQCFGI